jgi:hypothetical protein
MKWPLKKWLLVIPIPNALNSWCTMAIEIRQLTIKSNVEDSDAEVLKENTNLDAAVKDDLLRECRRLIMEMLDDKGSR